MRSTLSRLFRFSWKTQLRDIVGEQNMIEDPFELQGLNTDWTYKFKGNSQLAVTPRTTEQVSQIMKLLNSHKIPVVTQGGKTSLVGGSVPLGEEVILLMKHMNKVETFDQDTNILTIQPGCVLQNANEFLKQFDCEMPWDLGSRGTCQVGGNVSTNAGGLNVVKKGLLRGYVLGMEVVLPTGQILDLQNTNRKDNTGFDLKQLFIGSEGCLGVITKLNILTTYRAKEKKAIFIKLKTYEDVMKTLRLAKKELHDSLYAFEFIEGRIIAKSCSLLGIKNPFDQTEEILNNQYNYYVLLEAQGNQGVDDLVENFASMLIDKEICLDCVFNKNETEYKELWWIRDGLTEAQGKMGVVLKYDISLPPSLFEKFVFEIYPNRTSEGPLNSFYGHVGDGNMHYNIVFDSYEHLKREQAVIEPKIFNLVKKYRGSISAEHGIGQNKRQYLPLQKGEESIDLMRKIKALVDPNNILNPGKVLMPQTTTQVAQAINKNTEKELHY